MAKKTYKTFSLKSLNIHLKKNDKRIDITFRGGVQIDSTAKFTTSDEDLQKMLENPGVGFGRDFYLDEVVEKEAPKPEEEKPAEPAAQPEEKEADLTDVKGVQVFKNLPEMKARMAQLNIEYPDSNNYKTIRAAAKKAGYDFQVARNQ